jgi:hypothetical protein
MRPAFAAGTGLGCSSTTLDFFPLEAGLGLASSPPLLSFRFFSAAAAVVLDFLLGFSFSLPLDFFSS